MPEPRVKDGTWAEVVSLPPCDLCKQNSPSTPVEELPRANFDGAIRGIGTWAYMCGIHYTLYGMPLGEGQGQRLILMGTDQKVELSEREQAMARHPAGKGLKAGD